MVGAGFEELDFDKDHFIVKSLELFEQRVDDGYGLTIRVFLKIQPNETGLEVLAEEGTSFGDGPFDAGLGH